MIQLLAVTKCCGLVRLILLALALGVFCAPAAQAQESIAIWNTSPYGVVERNFEAPGFDLTYGGTRDAVAFAITLPDDTVLPLITVYSADGSASDWLCSPSARTTHGAYVASLRDFVAFKGAGADFAHVTRITVSAQPVQGTRSAAVQMQLKAATTIALEMSVVHVDTELDNEINAGDTLEYTVVVENNGADDALNADVSIGSSDFAFYSIALVAGSVTTELGTVTSGNGGGDTSLLVEIPFLGVRPCSSSLVTITFQARVEVPFDVVGSNLCAQAYAQGDNSPGVFSDDPDTPTANDVTCVVVVDPGKTACREILLGEGFQGGIPAGWSFLNQDGLTPNGSVSFVNDAWVASAENSAPSNFVATSTSFYTPSGQADDWLISPVVNLPGESTLRWSARAATAEPFRDGYEVRISTAGTAPADFLANPPLFSVAAEDVDWQLHTVDLAAEGYAFQPVYIAWRNVSTDKFLLYVDAIETCNTSPASAPTCPGTSLFGHTPNPVSGTDFQFDFTTETLTRLDSFNGLSEPVGQITWWGVEFNGLSGVPCLEEGREFRVALYADATLADDGSTIGAVAFDYTGTVTRTATGRSINVLAQDTFLPEYEYTLVLETPVVIPQGWLLLQSDIAPLDCYFAWLRSPEGDGTALNADAAVTPGSIGFDTFNAAFCLSPGAALEGEGAETGIQTADQDGNHIFSLSELLRVIQFYNIAGLSCAIPPSSTEDGFVPGGGGDTSCVPHDTDYQIQNWIISLSELLRAIQFYNIGGYRYCPDDGTEDGFCPGL